MGYFKDEDITPKGWEKWCGKRERERYKEARLACRKCLFTLAKYNLSFYSRNPIDTRKPDPYWLNFLDKRMREKNEELETIKKNTSANLLRNLYLEKVLFNNREAMYYPYAWNVFIKDQRLDKLIELASLEKLKKVSHGTTEKWLARGRILNAEASKSPENYQKILAHWEKLDDGGFYEKQKKDIEKELFKVRDIHRVVLLRSSRSFSDNISSIETKKCQQHLNHIYQHFKRNEIRREAVKKLTRGRNTNGYYKSNDSEVLERHPDNCFPSFSFNKHSQHPIRPGFTFGY